MTKTIIDHKPLSFKEFLMLGRITGTYASLTLDEESKLSVGRYIAVNNIVGGLAVNDLHCTVIYSKDATATLVGKPIKITGKPVGFHIFKTEDGKSVLTLKLQSQEIVTLHKSLRKKHNLSHHYDEYIPHITLSYDVGERNDFSLTGMPEVISFDYLHVEPLDTEWTA